MPAIRPHDTPTNTEASWDGPAAMADAPNDGTVLRYMNTWWAGGEADPDVKGNYKLPHHEPGTDTAAIIAGVNNALARLAVTDVPASDKPGIEAHLRRHRRDAGLEESMSQEEINETCQDNPHWIQAVLLQESGIEDAHEPYRGVIASEVSPLAEKAVRRDGTIEMKVIEPGWGSSGYYGREVLERDMPMVFKPGTHMYWNHATVSEQLERPERDLRDLAGVLVSEPRWQEAGNQGPGMYADAKVFKGYSEIIDEIGDYIGVSIFGSGVTEQGEIEGKKGPVVKSITAGQSVDFVTRPGAGGAIVSLFESAPLLEQSRLGDFLARRRDELELSNEDLARAAGVEVSTMQAILSGEIARPPDARLRRLADLLDVSFDALLRLVPGDRREPEEVTQGDEPRESEVSGDTNSDNPLMEVDKIMEEKLQEAERQLAEKDATIAKLQELLLLREAADFVGSALAKAELPDVTKARLQRQLVSNPPTDNGRLDEAKYNEMVETAVKEAAVEVATILGRDGRVTGMGGGLPSNGVPSLDESHKRTERALAEMGYGGNK